MLEESKRLEKEIRRLNKQLEKLPRGKITISNTGKYSKWYLIKDKEKTHIPKSNRAFAKQLATKKYLTLLVKDLEQEKEAIDFYLRHHKVEKMAEQLYNKTAYKELISPFFKPTSIELLQWMNSPYEKNMKYLEQLVHKTISGNVVRSKSEALIDTFLYKNKIPFRYECELELGDTILFPDFTIRHPETGKEYYWEHFGLMDDSRYNKNAFSKLQLYSNNGIIPGVQLITTYETKDTPLSAELVEKLVEYYFL